MKDFLLVFRSDYKSIAKASAEEMQSYMNQWQGWIDSITAQDKLAGGNHLEAGGKVVNHKAVITDGPYTEIKESILGYLIIKANSYAEALVIAKACPILAGQGNTVEVRAIQKM
ncbi:MAG: YciI family protein [Chitinophagaceae bacterium]